MARSLLIALAAGLVVLVGVIGAGVGFLYFSSTPVAEVERDYRAGTLGPAGVYSGLRILSSTPDSVSFAFELADGEHCMGSRERHRSGLLSTSGSGIVRCSGGPWQQSWPPGQVNCGPGRARVTGPAADATGFTIRITNTGSVPCHVLGPMQLMFFPGRANNTRPLNVDLRAAAEPPTDVQLQPGQSAQARYDVGGGPGACYSAGSVLVLASGPPLPAGGVRVCGTVTAHSPVLSGE